MTTKGRSKKTTPMYEEEWIMRELETTDKSIHQCREEFNEQCQEGMWDKLNKLIKLNGAIVLFGSEPFSSALRMSNIKNYKYDWKWYKDKPTNFINCKNAPMRIYEDIIIFSKGMTANGSKNNMSYNPQNLIEVNRKGNKAVNKEGDTMGSRKSRDNYIPKIQKYTNYPRNVLEFTNKLSNRTHHTQKPVALMEYLIKTYTNENELVLDFTCGSGTTGVACENTNRKFIGIELDEKYFDIGVKRMKEEICQI